MGNSPKANDSTDKGKRRDRLTLLTKINLVMLLLLCLAETFIAERHWLTVLLLYVPQHWIGIPGVLLTSWSLFRKQRRLLLLNGLGLLFFLVYFMGFNVPLRAGSTPSAARLRVMTYNINYGSRGAAQIVKTVRAAQPDVLCLQETREYRQWDDPVPELQRLLPGWHMARGAEVTTFSRYPIIDQQSHAMPRGTGRVILETHIDRAGQRFAVFNVHMSTAAGAVNRSEARLRRRLGLPIYVSATADIRRRQTQLLLSITHGVVTPHVVVGDFNNPPRGLVYRALTGRFQDAFRAAGWGWGYTFRSDLPVMRIDYIFLGPRVRATRTFVPTANASDHRPLVADITLPDNNRE